MLFFLPAAEDDVLFLGFDLMPRRSCFSYCLRGDDSTPEQPRDYQK